MIVIKSYDYLDGKDLRDVIAKKVGSSKEDIIYLTVRDHPSRKDHIYHINKTTALIGKSGVSLVGSLEDIEEAKRNLEAKLNIKLKP